VLVNALGQVKKWCRDGQEEIIIVPLEGTVLFSLSRHISPSRLDAVILARMLYRGPQLVPALRRRRYVTPPDSVGMAKALLPLERPRVLPHTANQPASRVVSDPFRALTLCLQR
jgi:hypothetical protein